MTIQQYKQQLYDACKEHSFFAQQALDRYDAATTDQEREQARIDNIQHLAAYHALQWALDKTIDGEQNQKYQEQEIEQLNADYAKLQEQFADYQMASDKEIAAQAKQAKIDVLNEVKTYSYYDKDYMDNYVIVSDIDKLIEEVENQ